MHLIPPNRLLRRLQHVQTVLIPVRQLHATPRLRTDGVYAELTAMRVRTPWIEALKQRDAAEKRKSASSAPDKANVEPSHDRPDTTPKSMSDSYHRVVIPLAHDPWLGDNYLNASGHIRYGTLLMDLDALSGVVAYKHTGDAVTTVTAAVDRIAIKHHTHEISDLELSGQVTFATGRSSMEVSLQVARVPSTNRAIGPDDILMTCAFTMVSLDPITKKPVNVAPLRIDTPEQQRIFDQGQRNYQLKKERAPLGLRKSAPNEEESSIIHSMWLRSLDYENPKASARKPSNVYYMSGTRLHSAQIMQPQYRNRHNFMIFGGFLLKQTFELAFSCVASFSHMRPHFLGLDPSTFENPVPVGSVLYLTATVAYTEPAESSSDRDVRAHASPSDGNRWTRVQVRVDSRVRNVEHGEAKPTGQFNYTFLVEKDVTVMPRSYSEYMIWTDARRRARALADIK